MTAPDAPFAGWLEAWAETRRLTYDLLAALPYAVMNFSPHPDFGTFIRQIRHVGDVQRTFLVALASGQMPTWRGPRSRELERSREEVAAYLRRLDAELTATLRAAGPGSGVREVRWGTEVVTVARHLDRLLSHEVLHQGLWIFYAHIADLPLPASWTQRWPGLAPPGP